MKVSDRDRNVNKVRIIGCVLVNFYFETFTNQMNPFIAIKSTNLIRKKANTSNRQIMLVLSTEMNTGLSIAACSVKVNMLAAE